MTDQSFEVAGRSHMILARPAILAALKDYYISTVIAMIPIHVPGFIGFSDKSSSSLYLMDGWMHPHVYGIPAYSVFTVHTCSLTTHEFGSLNDEWRYYH